MTDKDRLRNVAAKSRQENAWSPDKEIAVFKAELEQLYNNLQEWLRDLIDEQIISVSRIQQPVYEELLGSYEVTGLLLTIGGETVKFKPLGTMYFGCKGSVRVEGPYGDIDLSRVGLSRVHDVRNHPINTEWVWCIENQSQDKPVFTILNEASFTQALLKIVETKSR